MDGVSVSDLYNYNYMEQECDPMARLPWGGALSVRFRLRARGAGESLETSLHTGLASLASPVMPLITPRLFTVYLINYMYIKNPDKTLQLQLLELSIGPPRLVQHTEKIIYSINYVLYTTSTFYRCSGAKPHPLSVWHYVASLMWHINCGD